MYIIYSARCICYTYLKILYCIINIYGLTCIYIYIYIIAVITSSLPITNFRNINYRPIDKSYI